MDVLVVADGHYYRTSDGTVYVDTIYDYSFYKRYLSVFDHVYAAVRTTKVDSAPEGKKKCSGNNVTFLDLPQYTGPVEYIKRYYSLIKCIKKFCQKAECAIFRIPAATSNLFCRQFVKTKKPFAVEVVVDPWENFAPGTIKSPLRPIIRYSWTKLVKEMCIKANGVSYVTDKYLQEKYPSKLKLTGKGFEGNYSSVELPDDKYSLPKIYEKKRTWIIAHSANTFTDYGKGHIPLMQAVKKVRDMGYDVQIKFIGDGPKKKEFQKYASDLRITDAVSFLGKLPSSAEVKENLRNADMFVFPTRAEGLPRCLLEAMSEGLPCISSPTCGIPEIIKPEYLYNYNDVDGFAGEIIEFITHPDLMTELSKQNIDIAMKYSSSKLSVRRSEFYKQLKNEVYKSKRSEE